MNETQQRIKAYKDALPGLKERVAAVALLLVMSMAMLTSASFAWITLSRAPELSGVSTTVTANGNLEIALSKASGEEPAESAVGDSSAAEGRSVAAANLTWGNLINLSDPVYGLENLTMRPAQLNTASLLDSPLFGAEFSSDGRISQLTSNFKYTSWNLPEGNKPGYFGVSDNYGVRAISSVKIEAVGAEAMYVRMVQAAENQNRMAASMYVALGKNQSYMPSLATMMGLYMTARMNSDDASLSNPTCAIADIQNLRDMYGEFLECFDAEADAMAKLVNLQLFLMKGDGQYTPYTPEMIYATTSAKLKAEGVQITNLEAFIKDRNTVASDYAKLVEICESGTSLAWKDSGLNSIVNNLVDVGKCTIGADNTPISSIGASNALGYLSGTQEARITNGILYRFEERTGGYIEVKDLGISAKVKRMGITVPATVKANIQTTASRDYNVFTNDQRFAESLNDGNYEGGIPVAEDTYGLAVDFWVRTNSQNSYLTLEGNVITETNTVRAKGTDASGNEVELYTVTIQGTDENGESVSYSMDVYQADGTWYLADSHIPVTEEELSGQTPLAKMIEEVTVIGYDGVNRVWSENALMSPDATTQGSGSCYVYYADTPEDQARSLKLLEAFNVAFVDKDGKLMATAIMDTTQFYAENGRVTVPLVLSPSNSINLGENYEGEISYAITALEQNVPTRITAIVYLDGTKLTNKEVLSAAEIQGQLNIQFGSSESLKPIENESLSNKERRVSAVVVPSSFDYDTATGPMTSTVTVHVDGDEPNTVSAFFVRAINEAQGSREDIMTFTKNGNDWTADYTFRVPGNYVLRTVQLDGIDYDLATPSVVEITGFAVKSLTCREATDNHVNILTAANVAEINLDLQFATNDASRLPKVVQGRFLRSDGTAVNADFVNNGNTWSAKAVFHSSGVYTLQYLVLDGEYVELDEAFWQTANITMGMQVAVYTTSPHKFKYLGDQNAENEKMLQMQIQVKDNTGKSMPGFTGVKLTYSMKGSAHKTMDADLTWNGSYYVGEMQNGGAGIWQFSNVTVAGNVLTNASISPVFTIQAPDPPAYYDHNTQGYQYVPSPETNPAVMNVQITNSSAAAVQAYIIKEGATTGTWVNGTVGGSLTTSDGKPANHWSFPVPVETSGYQDGNWKLTQLKIWDVFDANGNAFTEESPLILDLSDKNNVTKVVCRVTPSFEEGKSKNFGKDANGNVTGTFMQSHTISDLSVGFTDFEGKNVSGVTDVQLKFTYTNGTSAEYGGYTSDTLNNATAGATITVTLTDEDGDGYFTQAEDAQILYAGQYITEFSYKVSGVTVTTGGNSGNSLPANAPVITVWSLKPTVTIDSISPNGSHKTLDMDNDKEITVTSGFSRNTATIYAQAVKNGRNGTIQTYPQITLKLNNMGNAESASMVFAKSDGGTVYLYTGNNMSGQTDAYAWTAGSDTCLRYSGRYKSGSCSGMTFEGAGTLTGSTVTLVYGGISYTVTVDTITIVNEQ